MTEAEHRAMLKQYGYVIICADHGVADMGVEVPEAEVEARRIELATRHPDKKWITYAPIGITQAHSVGVNGGGA